MALITQDVDFKTKFYSFEDLSSLDDKSCSENLVKQLAKKAFHKIILDDVRLIPLKKEVYAKYHKETCILDDEACAGAYSDRKSLKIMQLFDPKSPAENEESNLICHIWYYNLEDKHIARLGLKILSLAFEFVRVFPSLVPPIHELQFFKTPRDYQVRIFQDMKPQKDFEVEAYYDIDSYEEFQDHIKSIYDLLCSLYKSNLAHGDLNMRNLILDHKGKIKTLADFDMASSLKQNSVRYLRAWGSDLKNAVNAMLFYQDEESIEDWDSFVRLPLDPCSAKKIKIIVTRLFNCLTPHLSEINQGMFYSDFMQVDEGKLKSFHESTNPEKIFRHVLDF